MPNLTEKKILPYQAKQIYQLVMDIEKYPEFLPWCKQAKIIEKISDENLIADLLINFKSFFEKYRSDVTHGKTAENNYFVDVVAIEGPFKKLINKWKFRDLANGGCEIEFFIDFEFNSFFLTKMIGVIFEKATEKMMNAFEKRARELQ
jgi:coenzyme Q-binding protein COQ10